MNITITFQSESLVTFTAFVSLFSHLRNGIEVNIELFFSFSLQSSTHMNQHMRFQTRSGWNDEFTFGAIKMRSIRMHFLVTVERNHINEFHTTMIALQWLFHFYILIHVVLVVGMKEEM